MHGIRNSACLSLILICSLSYSQSFYWTQTKQPFSDIHQRYAVPELFNSAILDYSAFSDYINQSYKQLFNIDIPTPQGGMRTFQLIETPIMEPGLQSVFPAFKTFTGTDINDRSSIIKISLTDLGLHAYVFSPSGNYLIDPVTAFDKNRYIIYYKKDFQRLNAFTCSVEDSIISDRPFQLQNQHLRSHGSQLRTYRLAVACTGEYSQVFGGTVSGAMSAIIASVNRVNGIYESELAISFVLVNNNNQVVYTNGATDPYTNNNGSTMLSQNQTTLDAVIGSSNYDVGHVFSTGGGGVANLNVPCVSGAKARGVTGSPSPVGDAFDVDYVAHEIGHQFGAQHTFNSTTGSCNGNRSSSNAFEPGSGVTIMAYAGICGSDNILPNSIPYFHTRSFDQIINYITVGNGNNCPVITSTGNSAPVVNAGNDYTIPYLTPFILTGSATDANNDTLTYSWEEYDLGPSGTWNNPSGNAPLFRTFPPVLEPYRIFPKLGDILNNTTTIGEILPSYARSLRFRLTVRDNRPNGGGVTHNDDTVLVSVINTGSPFQVTYPNTSLTWNSGNTETITWNVASTNISPINCSQVNLLLSTDGGFTWPHVLASATVNDGSHQIVVPAVSSTQCRIKAEGNGNIFFDISNSDFTIQNSLPSTVQLNIKMFIQGFYTGNQQMTGILSPSVTDSVIIELRNPTAPYALQYSFNTTVNTSGNINLSVPVPAFGNSYYIVIRHRNSIETWSKTPVLMNAITNYDFTN